MPGPNDVKPKGLFNVGEFLSQNNLTLKGRNENGSIAVEDAEGNAGEFNPVEYLRQSGQSTDGISIKYNSPETAIETSPLSIEQRGALSVGNDKGRVNFLKKNFDDVVVDPDKGFVVQKNGIWHRVDPEGLGEGDAWEQTKELFADTVGDFFPEIAAVGTGIATAATAPLAIGAVGAGTKAITTALGRAVGTYDASVEEQIEDIALDGVLSYAGGKILPGVKPTLSKWMKPLNKIAKNASDGVKEVIANVYGSMTRSGPDAMRRLMDSPKVLTTLKSFTNVAPDKFNTSQIVDDIAGSQLGKLESLLEMSTKRLPQKYGEMLDELVSSKDIGKVKISGGEIFDSVFQKIDELNIGKFEKGKFVPLSFNELAQRAESQFGAKLLQEEAKALNSIFHEIADVVNVPQLRGRQAAAFLQKSQVFLNRLESAELEAGVIKNTPTLRKVLVDIAGAFRNKVGEKFEQAGLGNQYNQLSNLYKNYGDAVNTARSALKNGKTEGLLNKMLSSAGKKTSEKGEIALLEDLNQGVGKKLVGEIADLEAAKRFVPIAPKMGMLQGGAVGLSLASSGGLSLPFVAGLASQSSPRFVANQMPLIRNAVGGFNNILKNLGPRQLNELMNNPEFLNSAAIALPKALSLGEEVRSGLLNQAGVPDENQ